MDANIKTEDTIGLQFLDNDAGEHEGLGDAGIETYRDSPYASSARECGQNSRDAGTAHPVTLSFDLLKVPAADIPALEDYKAAVKVCLDQAAERDDEKEFDFFVQAEIALDAEEIKILRISDENTTGLIGPSVEGTPFHCLLKGTGVSNKDSDTAGGSFGIGKNAVYAISDIQTVFYSTVYPDKKSKKDIYLAQGKTKLVSHKDMNGTAKRATGYWGIKEEFQPVSEKNVVPDWLKRNEVGTSVFSIGFREFPNWQYRMAFSLIQNFFCAVHRGEMVFSVNHGEIQIDRNSLSALFIDEKILQAAEEINHSANLFFSRDLHECLISPDSIETLINVDGLGQVAIRVLIREDLPKRVCIIRNGMVITDSLEYFGDKFSRFPMYRDFVAFVEPREDKGSALIKKLENPRHDGLSAQRISDPKKQEAANTTMKSLAGLIRETIKEQTVPQHGDKVSIDEMSEYFADYDSSDRLPDPEGEEDPETVIYEALKKKKKRRQPPPTGKGKGGGAGGSRGKKGGQGGGKGPGTGGGEGGDGTLGESHLVELDGVRNTLVSNGDPSKRVIYFTPLASRF